MSAYAFPGLLPPISSSARGDVNAESVGNCSSVSENIHGSVLSPLHQQNEGSTFTGLLMASVDLLSLPSFTASRGAKDVAHGSFDSKTSSSSDTRSEEPGIAVKEAKIDPIRLIQSVTGRLQPVARKTLRRRGSRERLSGESSSPQNSPITRKQTMSFAEDDKQPPLQPNTPASKGSPHDEAIEFELSISFNGRKYTATRTLQCIVQLRDDLIREMDARRQWRNIRQAASHAFSTSAVKPGDGDAPTNATTEQDIDIQIPEIPPMSGEDSDGNSGFVGRGFTMLHAMATSYVPVMERWLRNVMAIVPQDSESLTNFLWEPISSETLPLEFPTKSCTSLATLGSIKELDYNTDDSDDDDEEDNW